MEVDVLQLKNAKILRSMNTRKQTPLRCLNTVLAVYEYVSFAKSWQEKGCSSQAEKYTSEKWQVKNTLMKNFD